MDKKGLTILEILIALIVFSLVVLSFSQLFVSGRNLLFHNRLKVSGLEIGKFYLDRMQMDVKESSWNTASNCLTNPLTGCETAPWYDPVSNRNYTPSYNIDSAGNLRRARVTISWPE